MGEAKQKAVAIAKGAVEACGNCRYFKLIGNTKGGFCRRHAPTLLWVGMAQNPLNPKEVQPMVNSYHPQMPADGWCGEYGRDLTRLDFSQIDVAALADAGVEGTA